MKSCFAVVEGGEGESRHVVLSVVAAEPKCEGRRHTAETTRYKRRVWKAVVIVNREVYLGTSTRRWCDVLRRVARAPSRLTRMRSPCGMVSR